MGLEYDYFISRLFAKSELNAIPLSGSFELTSRCSLDCKMCYIHRREFDREALAGEKSTEWWLSLAKTATERGMLMLLLTGGEPLIRKDFDEIYTECRKMGLLVSVNSNGTLIDDEKLRLFAKYPPRRLNITLYGASRKTYGELCGNAEAYDKVIYAITQAKELGIPIKLNLTLTPQNKGDIFKIRSFAQEIGVPIQFVSYMFPPVRTCGETVRLSAEEAAQMQFLYKQTDLGEDFDKYIDGLLKGESDFSIGGECRESCGEKIGCRAGSTTFWVTWNGEMRPCGMMNEPSISAEDFDKAWSRMRSEREKIFLPAECKNCALRGGCDVCAAVTLAESGKFDGVAQYACSKAAEFYRLCKEYSRK